MRSPPLIKLSRDLLKIHTKNINYFRKVQAYLKDNQLKFTTLPPQSRGPKKVVYAFYDNEHALRSLKTDLLHMAFNAYVQ